MNILSHLSETLKGSEIVKLGNEINDRIRQGEKIWNYTIGDFDPGVFPIPAALEELIVQSYRKHYTNYPPASGIPELRKAISKYIADEEGLQYTPEEIQVASGGRPLIYTLFKTIVNPGDKVLYSVPSWNNNHYTHICDAVHCVIDTTPENDFMPLAADIAPHIKGAALLCLCTPQNPTGTTLKKEELEKICDLVIAENNSRSPGEKKLYVMFDQMYRTLTYGSTAHHNPVLLRPEMKHYTIFIDGISKSLAATGVRVGWAMGPGYVISRMKALLSHVGAWAPMAEQKAVAAYLSDPAAVHSFMQPFKAALEERLVRIHHGFTQLQQEGFPVASIAPQAAIYLTVKIDLAGRSAGSRLLTTQKDVTAYLLDEAKLAIVPFYAFGASENAPWYRLSVGTCRIEEIDPMFEQLRLALEKTTVALASALH